MRQWIFMRQSGGIAVVSYPRCRVSTLFIIYQFINHPPKKPYFFGAINYHIMNQVISYYTHSSPHYPIQVSGIIMNIHLPTIPTWQLLTLGFPLAVFWSCPGSRQVEANSRGGSEEHVKRAVAARIRVPAMLNDSHMIATKRGTHDGNGHRNGHIWYQYLHFRILKFPLNYGKQWFF